MNGYRVSSRLRVITGPSRFVRHAPWAVWTATAVVGFAIGASALLSQPAFAARGHVASQTFGAAGSGLGQFDDPTAVAVEELDQATSGDIYVVDRGNNRVEVFDPSGAFLFEINGSGTLINEGTAAGSGGFEGEIETGRFESPESIAIDNSCAASETPSETAACVESDPSAGDVYIVDAGHDVIDKFTASGEYVAQLSGFEELHSVAVDPKGKVWTANGSPIGVVRDYDDQRHNELLEQREPQYIGQGGFQEPGLAVDSTEDFYLVNELNHLRVSKFSSGGTGLADELDTKPSTDVAVEEPGDEVYVSGADSIARFTSQDALVERFGEGQLTAGAGVAVAAGEPGASTVYVTDTTHNYVAVYTPEPPGPPTVEDASAADVSAESVSLSADINPRGLATTVRFEYGPCASLSSCASEPYSKESVALGAGSTFSTKLTGPFELSGLASSTIYHYRAVAENESGSRVGSELVFTTQAAASGSSLDGRQAEMVSPADKHGALVLTVARVQPGIDEAAADRPAISYLTNAPVGGSPTGYTNQQQVLAIRGPHEWVTQDLTLPHREETGVSVSEGEEYRYFAPNLDRAIVQPFGGFVPLSIEASEATAYAQTLPCTTSSSEAPFEGGSCFEPLVTGKSGYANVPAGTVFGISEEEADQRCPPSLQCGPRFVGASEDARHVVVASGVPLSADAPAAGSKALYESSGGDLTLISLLPEAEGGNATAALLGSQAASPVAPGAGADIRNAVSTDGSRVFWTAVNGNHLYLRDLNLDATIRLDLPEAGLPEPESGAEFQGASPDGSRAWFVDRQPLTSDASAGANLYECEIARTSSGPLACNLRDLSPTNPATGGVQGSLPGTSTASCDVGAAGECNVYFVSDGAYGAGTSPGNCDSTLPRTRCNLYVVHNGESPKPIAPLSGEDGPDWGREPGSTEFMISTVSPNGRWLAFMSSLPLTGYDNRDPQTGTRVEELYLYDATSETLSCVSCEPTGGRPAGIEVGPNNSNVPLVDADDTWNAATMLAASVPTWERFSLNANIYQPRKLDNEGRVFFDAYDGLVPADTNRQWDVYEYEPVGVGGCSAGLSSTLSTYRPARPFAVEGKSGQEGASCVGLISSGSASQESAFLDASESGSDVYFMTSARLSRTDEDGAYDVYDDHECTEGSPCLQTQLPEAASCGTAEECRPAGAAPGLGSGSGSGVASETLKAPGNLGIVLDRRPRPLTKAQKLAAALKVCRHEKRKKRAACERAARAKYGPAKHSTKSKPRKKKKR